MAFFLAGCLLPSPTQLYLEEQNFHLREAQRTRTQWAALYTLRVTLNLIVLSLFGGAFFLISLATQKANKLPETTLVKPIV